MAARRSLADQMRAQQEGTGVPILTPPPPVTSPEVPEGTQGVEAGTSPPAAMVKRSYYLPRALVAELEAAIDGLYWDTHRPKFEALELILRAGLADLPRIAAELHARR